SGNITLIADDDLFIGTLNGDPNPLPGVIGGGGLGLGFSGTVTMLANRDGGNEQRIIMRPQSSIQTSNSSANAILMQSNATDNSASDNGVIGGITLPQVTAGDGATITIDTAPTPAFRGSIIQQDNTTTVDAGPHGTVVLHAVNNLNGANPANNAALGDSVSPIRVRAGTVLIDAVNTPVRVAATSDATFTATVTANGISSLPGATLDLSTEAGVLTVGGASNTDGGTVAVNGAAGVVVNA